MKIEKIKIKNYKSIGEEQSLYLGENNVVSIIGKNESGKSNILTLLSKLSFHQEIPLSDFKNTFIGPQFNADINNTEIKMLLNFLPEELTKLQIEEPNSNIEFFVNQEQRINIKISGGLSEYFSKFCYLEMVEYFEESFER